MKVFTRENTWMKRDLGLDYGWGNGYVVIPEGHKLHGKSYDEIHELCSININGGITFSDSVEDLSTWNLPEGSKNGWVVGFDTCHSWDRLENWDKEAVMEEAINLMNQLKNTEL
jgi:hypothetical protein